MSRISYQIATIRVLLKREVLKYRRMPLTLLSIMGFSVGVWLLMGLGFGPLFETTNLPFSFDEFMFPGLVLMVMILSAIFLNEDVVTDRYSGFMRTLLNAPGGVGALIVGKCLGVSVVTLVQAGFIFLLFPLLGGSFGEIDWLIVVRVFLCASTALTAFCFSCAWLSKSLDAYRTLLFSVLVSVWFLSGALFPMLLTRPWVEQLSRWNPMAHTFFLLRHALYTEKTPMFSGSRGVDTDFSLLFIGGFTLVTILAAAFLRRENVGEDLRS